MASTSGGKVEPTTPLTVAGAPDRVTGTPSRPEASTLVAVAIAVSLAAPAAPPWRGEILDARASSEIVRHGPEGVRRLPSAAGEEWLAVRARLTPPRVGAALPPGRVTVTDRGRTSPLVGVAGTDAEALGPTFVLFSDAASAQPLTFPPARFKGPSWSYLYATAASDVTSTLTYTRVEDGRGTRSLRVGHTGALTVDESPAEVTLLFRVATGARRVDLRVDGRPLGSAVVAPDAGRPEDAIEKACLAGQAAECHRLAEAYASGAGVPSEVPRVVELLGKGCELGEGQSCTLLAHRYGSGRGVARDDARAIDLFARGCDRGHQEACTSLASRYFEGRGVEKNEGYAMAILTRACTAGGALACNNLGFVYAQGGPEVRDHRQAAELYRRACEAGLELGCTNLSKIHAIGLPLGDAPGAAEAQKKACDLGDTWSCSSVGWRYFHGRGVPPDLALAHATSLRACRARDASACALVGEIYWQGGPALERNPARAAEYYGLACDGGVLPSCTNLGLMHRDGLGIAKDEARGRALLEKACTAGYAPACEKNPGSGSPRP
jgi:TPR repeat protein